MKIEPMLYLYEYDAKNNVFSLHVLKQVDYNKETITANYVGENEKIKPLTIPRKIVNNPEFQHVGSLLYFSLAQIVVTTFRDDEKVRNLYLSKWEEDVRNRKCKIPSMAYDSAVDSVKGNLVIVTGVAYSGRQNSQELENEAEDKELL